MKKSLFKVILIISCIVFSAIVIVYIINYLGKYLSFFDTSRSLDTNYEIDSANITLNVSKSGKINVTEVMKYNPKGTINCIYRESEINNSVHLDGELKVYYNNKIIDKSNIKNSGWSMLSSGYNKINIQKTSQPFTITYKYTLSDVIIHRYNDLATFEYSLPANYCKTMKNITINVNLPQNAKEFNIFDKNAFGKCTIKKVSNKSYTVHKDKNDKEIGLFNEPGYTSIKVSFDTNIVETYPKYNMDAPIYRIKYQDDEDSYELSSYKVNAFQVNSYINIFLLATLLIITILMLIYYTCIKHIKKSDSKAVKLDYYREIENMVPPDLASILINKKFKVKEYIMTSLVMLLNSKKIEINEENKENYITIKDLSNITEPQKEILKFLFETQVLEEKMSIKMKDANAKFTSDKFFKKARNLIKRLKDMTTEQLYKLNIYDEFLSSHMRTSKQFAFVNIIFVIASIVVYVVLLLNDFVDFYSLTYLIMLILVFLIHLLGIWFALDVDKIYQKIINMLSVKTIDKLTYLIAILCILIILATKLNILFILSCIILLLSIRIFMFYDDEILSKKGDIEYEKVCGLKRFIEDFSYLNEKEFKDNVLWEKYLEYATAFDISKKITNNMSKADLFGFNSVIKDIEEIIDVFLQF